MREYIARTSRGELLDHVLDARNFPASQTRMEPGFLRCGANSGSGWRQKPHNRELEPAALDRIIEYGEGQPRATMLIAHKSHLTPVELETRLVDLTVVEQGLRVAMAADRIANEQTVERIRRSHKLGLAVAERLARDQPVYPGLARGAVRARTGGPSRPGRHRQRRPG